MQASGSRGAPRRQLQFGAVRGGSKINREKHLRNFAPWARSFLFVSCFRRKFGVVSKIPGRNLLVVYPPPPSRGGYLTFCLAIDCVHSRKGETSVRLLFRVVGSGFLTRPAVFSQPSWRVWVGWLCLHVAERFKRVAAAHTYPPLLSGANKTSTRFTRSRTSLESNSWQVFATRHGHETIGALAAPSEESEKSPHHTYDAQRACYFRAVL